MAQIVIPARINSSRLSQKVLKDVNGLPLFVATAKRAIEIVGNDFVTVATDSKDVIKIARNYNINCEMTSNKCLTGSDRVLSLARKKGYQKVINLQADEPLFPLSSIKKLVEIVSNESIPAVIAGFEYTTNKSKYLSLKVPKMLLASDNRLIYTSRHPLPASKISNGSTSGNIQVCIYAYDVNKTTCYHENRKKGPLESSEDLELLSCIENNIEVKCIKLENSPFSIDTEEDYSNLCSLLKEPK
tara:strand:- start:2489 stop:3220 length:732 start_codon:yes stop_codon:yes gene_type:complete